MIKDRIEQFNKSYLGLARDFWVNPDSCGNHNHYEEYIRFIAIEDHNRGKGTTFIFIRNFEGTKRILGYITFRATSYIKYIDDKPNGEPTMEILELAVEKDYECQKIGSLLVKYALTMAYKINMNFMGIRYVAVCADEEAVGFYEKLGFGKIADQGEILPRDQWNVNCVPMILKLPDVYI